MCGAREMREGEIFKLVLEIHGPKTEAQMNDIRQKLAALFANYGGRVKISHEESYKLE